MDGGGGAGCVCLWKDWSSLRGVACLWMYVGSECPGSSLPSAGVDSDASCKRSLKREEGKEGGKAMSEGVSMRS